MGQFRHPNVVKLYGVATQDEPVSYSTLVGNTYPLLYLCDCLCYAIHYTCYEFGVLELHVHVASKILLFSYFCLYIPMMWDTQMPGVFYLITCKLNCNEPSYSGHCTKAGHAICHVQRGHLFIELKADPVVTHIAR